MKKKVIIIDYHLGNLFSVKQACDTVGIDALISSSVKDVEEANALILPGVGAFQEAMKNLHDLRLIQTIQQEVAKGKPLFGICLGQQLLFTESEEFGIGGGLDLIPGRIRKFPAVFDQQKVRVPQIGWNTIYPDKLDWNKSPLMAIGRDTFMYFVHSYYVDPTDQSSVLTKTNYAGLEYCSGVQKDNIFATQFHPEKSGETGLSIYKNWATINQLI